MKNDDFATVWSRLIILCIPASVASSIDRCVRTERRGLFETWEVALTFWLIDWHLFTRDYENLLEWALGGEALSITAKLIHTATLRHKWRRRRNLDLQFFNIFLSGWLRMKSRARSLSNWLENWIWNNRRTLWDFMEASKKENKNAQHADGSSFKDSRTAIFHMPSEITP